MMSSGEAPRLLTTSMVVCSLAPAGQLNIWPEPWSTDSFDSGVTAVWPREKGPGWETRELSEMMTFSEPWVTAAAFTRRPSAMKFWAVCVAVLLGGVALRSGIWLHDDASQPQRPWFVEDIYYPTWNRLDGLLLGVMLAAWQAYRPASWARAATHANRFALAGVVVMGLAFWLFRDRVGLLGNSIGWPVLSLGLALLVFAGAQPHGVLGARAVPGAAWVAAISYSLYLVHKPVYGLVQSHWGSVLDGRGIGAWLAYGVASVAAAALLHYGVERPGLRLRARVLARSAPSA